MEIKILEPVELLQNIRRDGGDAICAAKTVDGGVAFVRWDPKKSKWIIDSDLTLGDLLESMPMGEKNLELLNINQKPLLSLEEQYKIINDNYELSKISLDR